MRKRRGGPCAGSRRGPSDFADCLVERTGAARECEYTATLDKAAARAGMRLIE
jgi:predicted nucleic-acid-binding protein